MRLYNSNEMARIGCHGCEGCSKCCKNMGQSIVLNPYDIYNLSNNMGLSFEELLCGPVELTSEAGIVQPCIKMIDSAEGSKCGFLDSNGRCSIHSFRPGICRLFPLGRDYSDGNIRYFILEDECPAGSKTKEKIGDWLGFSSDSELRKYEEFLGKWHSYISDKRKEIYAAGEGAQAKAKEIGAMLLNRFYIPAYECEDFYLEIYRRMEL